MSALSNLVTSISTEDKNPSAGKKSKRSRRKPKNTATAAATASIADTDVAAAAAVAENELDSKAEQRKRLKEALAMKRMMRSSNATKEQYAGINLDMSNPDIKKLVKTFEKTL
jgi:hypothetical protein